MKPAKAKSGIASLDEIVETLKLVPKARLRIVHDVVEALAEPKAKSKPITKRRSVKKKSLLDTLSVECGQTGLVLQIANPLPGC